MNVIFKYILIYDRNTKKAVYHTFNRGLNIVTSSDNHVGKSILVKTIYHTLGAKAYFDDQWQIGDKVSMVEFSYKQRNYNVVRYRNKVLILDGKLNLIYVSQSITKDLAPFFANLFSLKIELEDKKKNIVLAPPVFLFLPYYIDQDKGWADQVYVSFNDLAQFNKNQRLKSLYYHLGLYETDSVLAAKSHTNLLNELKIIKEDIETNRNTLKVLKKQDLEASSYTDFESLDQSLESFKIKITDRLKTLDNLRGEIRAYSISLYKYEQQEKVVKDYRTVIKKMSHKKTNSENREHICPKCHCAFSDSFEALFLEKYSDIQDDFILDQITYLKNIVYEKITPLKSEYIKLSKEIKALESSYTKNNDYFEQFIKHKGINKSIESIQNDVNLLLTKECEATKELTSLRKKLKSLKDIKDNVDNKYLINIEGVLKNFKIWKEDHRNTIKVNTPIVGQGSLSVKYILSNYLALFQTQRELNLEQVKFPFVVDSPRTHESSKQSSIDILTAIIGEKSLDQIILATIDFDDYKKYIKCMPKEVNIITLTEQNSLLNSHTYDKEICLITKIDLLLEMDTL